MFIIFTYSLHNASENMSCVVHSAGTASVIIALTDGELNEWQFDTAQREVRRVETHLFTHLCSFHVVNAISQKRLKGISLHLTHTSAWTQA